MILYEYDGENCGWSWYLQVPAHPDEVCTYEHGEGLSGTEPCGEPATWFVASDEEIGSQEYFCGTHASEILQQADLVDVREL